MRIKKRANLAYFISGSIIYPDAESWNVVLSVQTTELPEEFLGK
jgi:hypothetical protein